MKKRKWGGLTDRILVASASSYVVSPGALGPASSAPERAADRLSASYLIALAARVVSEVSKLVRRAKDADLRLATLSLDERLARTDRARVALAAAGPAVVDAAVAEAGRPRRFARRDPLVTAA